MFFNVLEFGKLFKFWGIFFPLMYVECKSIWLDDLKIYLNITALLKFLRDIHKIPTHFESWLENFWFFEEISAQLQHIL